MSARGRHFVVWTRDPREPWVKTGGEKPEAHAVRDARQFRAELGCQAQAFPEDVDPNVEGRRATEPPTSP